MTDILKIHPENPQLRLIKQAVNTIKNGGIIAYPTDSAYALGCQLGNKKAIDKIREIRKLDNQHNFTLVCGDLSDLGLYAKIDNVAYRIIKKLTPGPYTFIFTATKEVPNRLQQKKKKSIGLRVPEHEIVLALLAELGEPIMSVSLIMPNQSLPLNNADEIHQQLNSKVDLIIDGGSCHFEPTTVIDFTDTAPRVARKGSGDTQMFE